MIAKNVFQVWDWVLLATTRGLLSARPRGSRYTRTPGSGFTEVISRGRAIRTEQWSYLGNIRQIWGCLVSRCAVCRVIIGEETRPLTSLTTWIFMVCITECKSGLNIAAAANMGRLHSEAWDRELLRVRSEAAPPPPGALQTLAGSESQL